MNKEQLLKSRAEMLAVLDVKLKDMPEWRAYRAMEDFLQALNGSNPPQPASIRRRRGRPSAEVLPYSDLGLRALEAAGSPLSTPDMVDFIAKNRPIPHDPHKARLNIGSAFSRDKRLRSLRWQGGSPAWWFADRPLPEHRSAAE